MSLPTSQPIPDDDEIIHVPPARKRRGRRLILPLGADERAAFLDELAHRASPSFDFFLFSLAAGGAFGVAILLNAPSFFVLAALLAPFMGPVIGLSLATIVGSGRFFLLTLGGSFVGAFLVFAGGLLAGLTSRFWSGLPVDQALISARFSWPTFILLSLGTILTTLSLVRSDQRPLLPSAALAYCLYLPVAAAGYGATSGISPLFPDGLIVFLVYLTWSTLLGTLVLAVVGFRPLNLFGYTLGTTIALTSLTVLIGLSGLTTALRGRIGLPELNLPALVQPTPSLVENLPTPADTPTITPPSVLTATRAPTHTLVPSRTPTLTATLSPTPVWASVNAPEGDGAYIRAEPNSSAKILTSMLNGTLVEILPEVEKEGNTIWAHVRTSNNVEGWVVQALLMTATPSANW